MNQEIIVLNNINLIAKGHICVESQFSSVSQSCPTPCDPLYCSMPDLPVHHQHPEFTQTHVQRRESVMPSSHLILCCPLLLLPPIPPSIRVFSNESTLRMRWPKYWSFSFSISPSKEHPGLTPFRMDWLDLLAVQGTLKSLFQHHSSKASILRWSAFFTVQLCHPYMTARSRCEELRPWQRSWGRRLGIRKGGIEPQESPWKFLSIYPQNQSLPTFCFVLSPTPLTLRGAVPHYLFLKNELSYSSS